MFKKQTAKNLLAVGNNNAIRNKHRLALDLHRQEILQKLSSSGQVVFEVLDLGVVVGDADHDANGADDAETDCQD
jgi:hypothetical protein